MNPNVRKPQPPAPRRAGAVVEALEGRQLFAGNPVVAQPWTYQPAFHVNRSIWQFAVVSLPGTIAGARARDEGYLFWVGWVGHLTDSLFNTSDATGPFRRCLFPTR